jgi:hypothetical protein
MPDERISKDDLYIQYDIWKDRISKRFSNIQYVKRKMRILILYFRCVHANYKSSSNNNNNNNSIL